MSKLTGLSHYRLPTVIGEVETIKAQGGLTVGYDIQLVGNEYHVTICHVPVTFRDNYNRADGRNVVTGRIRSLQQGVKAPLRTVQVPLEQFQTGLSKELRQTKDGVLYVPKSVFDLHGAITQPILESYGRSLVGDIWYRGIEVEHVGNVNILRLKLRETALF